MTLLEASMILMLRKHGATFKRVAELHAQKLAELNVQPDNTNADDITRERGKALILEAAKVLELSYEETNAFL